MTCKVLEAKGPGPKRGGRTGKLNSNRGEEKLSAPTSNPEHSVLLERKEIKQTLTESAPRG